MGTTAKPSLNFTLAARHAEPKLNSSKRLNSSAASPGTVLGLKQVQHSPGTSKPRESGGAAEGQHKGSANHTF